MYIYRIQKLIYLHKYLNCESLEFYLFWMFIAGDKAQISKTVYAFHKTNI